MSPRNVWTVMRKELRETLRDRRTLLLMVVVPVFLYPALLVLIEQLALFGQRSLEAEPARVVVVGAAAGAAPDVLRFLDADSALRTVGPDGGGDPFQALREGRVAAVVEVGRASDGAAETVPVRVLYDASREPSRRAHQAVEARLREWSDTLLARRLSERGLPPSFAEPVAVVDSSVATAEQLGGYALGRFLPVLLIFMTLLGAFYPAIDLTAGEKERGTLETLLTSPVPASDIVAGKFLTVALSAFAAAVLNLASMLLTFQSGVFQLARAAELQFQLPWHTVVFVLLVLVPLCVFFAALFIGIAVRSASFKEAQSSLTPVQLAAIVPIYLPLIPGIPFSYGLALVPLAGVAMLFRELMSGTAAPGPALVAFGATVVYALLALRFAARSFGREDVLFGGGAAEVPQGGWRERLAGWRGAPQRVPRPATALAFVGLVGLLYFYLGVRFQVLDMVRGIVVSQWLLLALPAVLLAWGGPYRVRDTLALRRPSGRGAAAALLVIVGAIPTGWALGWLQAQVMEVPAEYFKALEGLLRAESGAELAWLLFALALTPAVCEELVFRGVLLQGLARELSMRRAVLGSALVFGAYHLSLETAIRFLPTAWLGLLLGYVVWRTRSLYLGVLMHFVNNAVAVALVSSVLAQRLVAGADGEPRWALVVAGVAVLAAGLRLLPRRRPATAAA